MQKKLIVLALASAFAAPAFAATSNVDMYGQFDVSIDYVNNLGSANTTSFHTNDHAWRASSNASRIGIKGSEDLGGGLAAIWQYEQGVNLDAGTGQANGGGWGAERNSFLGLKGGWGTALIGTHDTPYKLSTAPLDPFADTAGDYNAIIGSLDGFNVADLRLGNVIAYISPSFNGLAFAGAYSFQAEQGQETIAGNTPGAYSLMVNYANGPLYIGGGFEKAEHISPFGTFPYTDVDLESWKLGAGYTFGNFTVNAIYDHIKLSPNTGSTEVKRSAWGLNGVYNMGNIAFKAGYYKADSMDNTNDTGADMWELGADYMFSKRTKAYLVYAQTNNDNNGSYCVGGSANAGFGTSGVNAACAITVGKNPDVISVGLRHTF